MFSLHNSKKKTCFGSKIAQNQPLPSNTGLNDMMGTNPYVKLFNFHAKHIWKPHEQCDMSQYHAVKPENQKKGKKKNSEIVSKHLLNTTGLFQFTVLFCFLLWCLSLLTEYCGSSCRIYKWKTDLIHLHAAIKALHTTVRKKRSIRRLDESAYETIHPSRPELLKHTIILTAQKILQSCFWRQTLHKPFHNTWTFILDNEDHETESVMA